MPNTRKYKERVSFSFNTDRELLGRAQANAKKQGLTSSEYITNLMREDLQKNEVGRLNPLNITYGLHNNKSTNGITISLDRFMDPKEARELVKPIPNEALGRFFDYNLKKVSQQVQLKQTGKITL